MLRKVFIAVAAMVAAVGIIGCSSVEVGTSLKGNQKLTDVDTVQTKGHINADIWGLYFFNLPMFSGSSNETGKCAVFSDTVQTDNGVALITREAKYQLNSTAVIDMTSRRENIWIFPLLVFWYRDVQVSGNAVR